VAGVEEAAVGAERVKAEGALVKVSSTRMMSPAGQEANGVCECQEVERFGEALTTLFRMLGVQDIVVCWIALNNL